MSKRAFRFAVPVLFLALPCVLLAQDKPLAEENAEPAKKVLGEGYRQQPADDEARPHTPKKPRPANTQDKVEAITLFMAGRIHEQRREFQKAYASYEKAVKLDPDSAEIYQSLVPLAFRLNKQSEGVKYAETAIKLDPDDFESLRRLGVVLASQRKIPEAIQMMERAVASKKLKKESAPSVILHRDLGILYRATAQTKKAAEHFAVVFDALVNPSKYQLDFRARSRLLAEQLTSFESLGQLFLEAENYELAVQAFEKAVSTRRGNPGTLSYYLAQVYVQTQEFEKALTNLQKYFDAQLQTKGRDAYELLADVLAALKKSDELIPRLEKLSKADKRNATLQYFLAEEYVNAERLQEAAELYQSVLKDTGDVAGYRGLASIYRKQKNAEKYLEALVQALPRNLDTEGLNNELAESGKDKDWSASVLEIGTRRQADEENPITLKESFLLGRIAAELDKIDESIAYFRAAMDKARGSQLGEIYNELGSQLLIARKYGEAASIFEEATRKPALVDSRPNYLYRLSQARELNGETDLALKAIRQAKAIVPHPLLKFQEGWIYYHSQQYDKAIEVFEDVITSHPGEKEIVRRCQFNLSNVYVAQGNIRKGEIILEQVLAEEPDDPSVNNDLGYLYADQGKNLEKAEKMIRKALKAEPENGAYLDSMGWVLYKLGRHEEALEYLQKAEKTVAGEDATILDHLADCYNQLKQPEKAVDLWKKALESAEKESRPDEKLIKAIKEKLEKSTEGVGEVKPESPETP